MSIYDPPSDPYGNEKSCPICDAPLEYNPLVREWECNESHEDPPMSAPYNPDCPACLRNVWHTGEEHEQALSRNAHASSPDYDEGEHHESLNL